MIARQYQALLSLIPDGEGEHAVEMTSKVLSFFLIKMDNGFCVGARSKTVTGAFQPLPQLLEIVNFTVIHNPHRSILVRQRHVAAFEIDD